MTQASLPSLMTDPGNYYEAFGIGTGEGEIPMVGACIPDYYFSYVVQTPGDIGLAIFHAIRCTEGGKPPQVPAQDGTPNYLILMTDFKTGTDTWSSNAGY